LVAYIDGLPFMGVSWCNMRKQMFRMLGKKSASKKTILKYSVASGMDSLKKQITQQNK